MISKTYIELLKCMTDSMKEIAARVGSDQSIPPGMVAEAFNIRNRISKFKIDLEEYTHEED